VEAMMGQTIPIFINEALDPDTLASLAESYDRVLDILSQTGEMRSAPDDLPEILAEHMIHIAACGERDSQRLTIAALKYVRSRHLVEKG
jgi:hypothetical protein